MKDTLRNSQMEKKNVQGKVQGIGQTELQSPSRHPTLQKQLQSSPNSVFKEQIKSGFNLQPHLLQVGGWG